MMPCGKRNVEQSSMSIDGHEVVPQKVQSACVVIVACGVLIPDPRKVSWKGSKVNTDQDETRAPGCPTSVQGWASKTEEGCNSGDTGPNSSEVLRKNASGDQIYRLCDRIISHPIIITHNGLHICPPEGASHGSNFPLTVGVTIWRNQFRDTSHSLGAAQSTIVTLFGDEGG